MFYNNLYSIFNTILSFIDIRKVFALDQQLEEFELTHKEAAVKNLNLTEALDLEIRIIFQIYSFR